MTPPPANPLHSDRTGSQNRASSRQHISIRSTLLHLVSHNLSRTARVRHGYIHAIAQAVPNCSLMPPWFARQLHAVYRVLSAVVVLPTYRSLPNLVDDIRPPDMSSSLPHVRENDLTVVPPSCDVCYGTRVTAPFSDAPRRLLLTPTELVSDDAQCRAALSLHVAPQRPISRTPEATANRDSGYPSISVPERGRLFLAA